MTFFLPFPFRVGRYFARSGHASPERERERERERETGVFRNRFTFVSDYKGESECCCATVVTDTATAGHDPQTSDGVYSDNRFVGMIAQPDDKNTIALSQLSSLTHSCYAVRVCVCTMVRGNTHNTHTQPPPPPHTHIPYETKIFLYHS